MITQAPRDANVRKALNDIRLGIAAVTARLRTGRLHPCCGMVS
jgi:hypothetical protein